MWTTLLMIFAVAAAVVWWMTAREAAERARDVARGTCRQAGVQLLDQTVTLTRLSLTRAASGWLTLRRRYAFDFSRDGASRESGSVTLVGSRLEVVTIPPGPSAPL